MTSRSALAGSDASEGAGRTAAAVTAIGGIVERAGAGVRSVESMHLADGELLTGDPIERAFAGSPHDAELDWW